MISLPRSGARLLTGSTYLLLGIDAVRAPGGRVDMAGPLLTAIRRFAPLPENDELIVRGNAAVQVIGGAMLAAGRAPRAAAFALLASLIPTTAAGHAFWTVEDPAVRNIQRIQFHKNLAMIGGLVFALLDRPPTHPPTSES